VFNEGERSFTAVGLNRGTFSRPRGRRGRWRGVSMNGEESMAGEGDWLKASRKAKVRLGVLGGRDCGAFITEGNRVYPPSSMLGRDPVHHIIVVAVGILSRVLAIGGSIARLRAFGALFWRVRLS